MSFNRSTHYKILLCFLMFFVSSAAAHEDEQMETGSATYLGNEGVLIDTEFGKVLFDPFFHNDYGNYTLVPEAIREAIFAGKKPYDGISVIALSHAHGDHFSAEDSLRYLQENPGTKLIGPAQAIDKIKDLAESNSIEDQMVSVQLLSGDPAESNSFGPITVESLRIPHAGWPARKDVANLVHRVTFGTNLNVIHMGDADPNDLHFKPYQKLWSKSISELAFPPYWFFTSRQGPMILNERINVSRSVGVHVPTKIPGDLRQSGEDYFSNPGEVRAFSAQ